MPEFVSRAIKENVFSLPQHNIGLYIPDSFHAGKNPLNYPYNPGYKYKAVAAIHRPGEQYFPDGVVAFTDAEFDIAMLPDNRIPYMGIEATKNHEIGHIERRKKSLPQDEVQINRDVVYMMGLSRFPFPSYS